MLEIYSDDGMVVATYGDREPKWGEIDPVYPDKKVQYVRPEIDCIIHNYLNGWKCINCGSITNTDDERPNPKDGEAS